MISAFLKFLRGHRGRDLSLHSAGLVLLTAVILSAAGCYETDVEVINASSAVAVYNAPGNYTFDAGGSLTISAVPDSNDYRFREVSKENKVSTGYLRVVPLRGDIYIVQAKYDNESVYYLAFYQFTSDRRFKPLDSEIDEQRLGQLAQQYGVKIEWDPFFVADHLSGSSSNILAFLRAHASLPFSPAK